MSDPFQNVSASDGAMISLISQALERRGDDPGMAKVFESYLGALTPDTGAHLLEVGAGTGAIARRIAERFPQCTVIGSDPSPELIEEADRLGADIDNLSFEVADGTSLPQGNRSMDVVFLLTVLSHVPDPAVLIAEAVRVLKPGGQLVICDADFSKGSLANAQGDPFQSIGPYFAANFVTDAWVCAKLPRLMMDAGLERPEVEVISRTDFDGNGLISWVLLGNASMVETGLIGKPLADALEAEFHKRAEAGTLFGFLPFVTAIARKPD